MKTLKVIQVLAKIGKIFSKIVFICCIVGVCGCVTGIIGLAVGLEVSIFAGVDLEEILQKEAEISSNSLYCYMAASIFICAGEGVVAKFAEIYFDHELAHGTPFNKDDAKELFRLGIITIGVSLSALICAEITQNVMVAVLDNAKAMKLSNDGSWTLGLVFIVISSLCKLGAELNEKPDEKNDTPQIGGVKREDVQDEASNDDDSNDANAQSNDMRSDSPKNSADDEDLI